MIQLLKFEQVAEALGVTPRHVHNLAARDGLPVVRLGRSVRVDPNDLQRWLEERKQVERQPVAVGGAS